MSEKIEPIQKNSDSEFNKWTYDEISVNLNKNKHEDPFNIESLPDFKDDDYICTFTHRNVVGERSIFNKIKLIIQEAKKSKSYLILASFMINNTEIFKLIEDSLEVLKGKVYIIVGNKFNTFSSYNKQNLYHNIGLSNLVHKGAQIRFVRNAHLKFISSKRSSVICTTNFSTEGLFRNPEFAIYLNDREIAIQLNRVFFYLWYIISVSVLINDEWINIHSRGKNSFSFKKIQKNKPRLIISSTKKIADINRNQDIISPKNLYTTLIELLQSAKKSIYLSVYLFTNNNNNLKRIVKILQDQKEKGISDIRILIPSVKVQSTPVMKQLLELLSKKGIGVKFYREVHGKCVIIDRSKFLLFTGNFDKYLADNDSCDIGYLISRPSVVQNFCLLFDHLWKEAANMFDQNAKINLQLDLVIRSYELISSRLRISVSNLKRQIENAKSIQFFFHPLGKMLKITGKNDWITNVYFICQNQDEIIDQGGYFIMRGIIDQNSKMILKEALVFSVEKLDLRLIWAIN